MVTNGDGAELVDGVELFFLLIGAVGFFWTEIGIFWTVIGVICFLVFRAVAEVCVFS